jgi:general secretion pathway protein D
MGPCLILSGDQPAGVEARSGLWFETIFKVKVKTMKISFLLFCGLMAASLANAAPPIIEIEVRFIEIRSDLDTSDRVPLNLDTKAYSERDMTNFLMNLERSCSADVMAAPKVCTQSGTNATIKVVTEYRYPTVLDIQSVSATNGSDVVRAIAVIPSNFETRDVGVTLNVTPVFNEKQNTIDLKAMAEIVSEPTWKEYPITYEGMNGTKQSVVFPQPFFHTRQVSQNLLSIPNNSTMVTGGLITTAKRQVEERVPVLGAIPWLGRLFRRSREITENRNLVITVTARTVGDHP